WSNSIGPEGPPTTDLQAASESFCGREL
ncbi:DUF6053 domain-containing protein, partial [Lysobacter sp. 2RAB21]